MNKGKLSFKIFKDLYGYRHILLPEGLIFYTIEEDAVYVHELMSAEIGNLFLTKAIARINDIAILHSIDEIHAWVDQDKNKKWFKLLIKNGARILGTTGSLVKISINTRK